MKDLFKKGLLVGLGAAEFTRETLARAITELEKKGEMTGGEAKKIMESFSRIARKRRKELEETIGKGLAAVLGKMHVATESRVEQLEERLKKLEKKLGGAQRGR